jgi:hypothetical protein
MLRHTECRGLRFEVIIHPIDMLRHAQSRDLLKVKLFELSRMLRHAQSRDWTFEVIHYLNARMLWHTKSRD